MAVVVVVAVVVTQDLSVFGFCEWKEGIPERNQLNSETIDRSLKKNRSEASFVAQLMRNWGSFQRGDLIGQSKEPFTRSISDL